MRTNLRYLEPQKMILCLRHVILVSATEYYLWHKSTFLRIYTIESKNLQYKLFQHARYISPKYEALNPFFNVRDSLNCCDWYHLATTGAFWVDLDYRPLSHL